MMSNRTTTIITPITIFRVLLFMVQLPVQDWTAAGQALFTARLASRVLRSRFYLYASRGPACNGGQSLPQIGVSLDPGGSGQGRDPSRANRPKACPGPDPGLKTLARRVIRKSGSRFSVRSRANLR